jgi:hypothetical protein
VNLHKFNQQASIASVAAALPAGDWIVNRAPSTQERAISEEGQLFDIPDVSYYSASSADSFVNTAQLASDCAELTHANAIGIVHASGNAVVVLHHDVEDYVTYAKLPLPAGGDPIWAPASVHSIRAPAMAAAINTCFLNLQSKLGVRVYLQPYEFAFPEQLCNASLSRNCTLGSPYLQSVLNTRYAELYERIPALDGVVSTVTDSWRPRAGYSFSVLWSNMAELGRLGAALYEAVVGSQSVEVGVASRELVYRLWVLGSAIDWDTFVDSTPPGLRISVKAEEGDFVLDQGPNRLLQNRTVLATRRFEVLVDAFREYNGWGAAACYMGKQWPTRLGQALANGAVDVNVWGAWSPGCTWPTTNAFNELQNVTGPEGQDRTWGQHWNGFRLFGQSGVNGAVSVSGVANARLAGDVATASLAGLERMAGSAPGTNGSESAAAACSSVLTVAGGAVPVPAGVIAACVSALVHSIDIWIPATQPQTDFAWQWTMMLNADEGKLAKSFTAQGASSMSPAKLDAASAPALSAAMTAEASARAVVAGAAAAVNPTGAAALLRSVRLAALYSRTLVCFKEAAWWALFGLQANATQGPSGCAGWAAATDGPGRSSGCAAFNASVVRLQPIFSEWEANFTETAVFWQVTAPDPFLNSRPSFWSDGAHGPVYPRSVRGWVDWLQQEQASKFCGAAA